MNPLLSKVLEDFVPFQPITKTKGTLEMTDDVIDKECDAYWDSLCIRNQETRRRIKISVWAYAYEFLNESCVSDEEFDRESLKVDLDIATTRPDLDLWFKENFEPHTGMWIRKHPELDKIEKIYKLWYQK